jgi:hypothetical protein
MFQDTSGINPLANLPVGSSTATFPVSHAPLLVDTNTLLSALSISRLSFSSPQGFVTVFLIPVDTVSFVFKTAPVVSLLVIATFLSAHAHDASVLSVTSGLLSSLNVMSPVATNLLPVVEKLPSSSFDAIAVLISFQKA